MVSDCMDQWSGQYLVNQVKQYENVAVVGHWNLLYWLINSRKSNEKCSECKLITTYYINDPWPLSIAKVSHKLDFKGRPELESADDRKFQCVQYCLSLWQAVRFVYLQILTQIERWGRGNLIGHKIVNIYCRAIIYPSFYRPFCPL